MVRNKTALILGMGQDGSYMTELLYRNGYQIHCVVRENTDQSKIAFINSLVPYANIIQTDILNKDKLFELIESIHPNEIYNFAGISNVFNPWNNLDIIFELNGKLPQNCLEAILTHDKSIKFFQASSCLIFGRDTSFTQNEDTMPNPIYPYGAAKLYADNMIKEFRKSFNLYCCSAIFYPHESPRRGNGFFSKKVSAFVNEIKNGGKGKLKVGDLSTMRDYGYAPDYMDAAFLMMNNREPKDYVVGTGKLISMKNFVEKCFNYVGLDYKSYVEVDPKLCRKNETNVLCADASKIYRDLGWKPNYLVDDIISILLNS